MKNVTEMNRTELRKACKENGIKYSKLTVGGMRDELRKVLNQPSEDDKELIEMCGHAHCPHCGIHLSNGLVDFDTVKDLHGDKAYELQKMEWSCLGCNGEWGNDVIKPVGLKIEKDRPEQNGIVRPSVGGKCRAIWDACDAYLEEKGAAPMPKDIKVIAEEKGWNLNNAVIEMYQWRKFHGITGRQK